MLTVEESGLKVWDKSWDFIQIMHFQDRKLYLLDTRLADEFRDFPGNPGHLAILAGLVLRFDIRVSWRARRTRAVDVKHDQMRIMKDDENMSLNTEQCGLRRWNAHAYEVFPTPLMPLTSRSRAPNDFGYSVPTLVSFV